jgi:hypothetical protein
VCDRQRFTIRTSDEIISRIEALAGISGESKNSVANVLLAMQLGGVTCGATSKKAKGGSNGKEPQESSVVHDDGDGESSEESGAKQNKRVSPPTTPSSQKKKGISKDIPKKEKVELGNGSCPKSFEECLEYFIYRRIPDPEPKAREFWDYYETTRKSNGWYRNKAQVKRWGGLLTTWIGNNKGWKPIEKAETDGLVLDQVLAWMEKEHPEWYEKFKEVKNINEIDGYYIDEFRGA